MKQILLTGMLCLCLSIMNGWAQTSPLLKHWDNETERVIQNIPALYNVAAEISAFETKTEGKQNEFKNAAADRNALYNKYVKELQAQIVLLEANTTVVTILTTELENVKKKINN